MDIMVLNSAETIPERRIGYNGPFSKWSSGRGDGEVVVAGAGAGAVAGACAGAGAGGGAGSNSSIQGFEIPPSKILRFLPPGLI